MKKILIVTLLLLAVSLSAIQSDKILHGWGCFVLSVGTLEVTESVPVSFIVPAIVGIGYEYMQKNNPRYGVYNLEDIIADLVGCVIAIPVNCWLFKVKQSDEEAYRREQYLMRYGTEYPFVHQPAEYPLIIDWRGKDE